MSLDCALDVLLQQGLLARPTCDHSGIRIHYQQLQAYCELGTSYACVCCAGWRQALQAAQASTRWALTRQILQMRSTSHSELAKQPYLVGKPKTKPSACKLKMGQ